MYKIFVGNKPIILTTKVETETNFKNFLIDSVDINKVLSKLKKDKYDAVHLIGSNKELLLKKFLSLLPNVIAGGGKVYNKKEEILFIFRNGKWDLPKGKAEPKETINQTALREVEEETGYQPEWTNTQTSHVLCEQQAQELWQAQGDRAAAALQGTCVSIQGRFAC